MENKVMPLTPAIDLFESQHTPTSKPEIYYPETDGKPLGETEWHVRAILQLFGALDYFFRRATDVYIAADMLLYYEQGESSVFKVPDVFVVRGVSKAPRRIYKLWEEQVAPCAIFEITSRRTRWEDVAEKRGLYEVLGVREYFLFDPLEEYLQPRLQGFQLVEGHYEPLPLTDAGGIVSTELGVVLQPDGFYLRVVDPASGEVIPSMQEAAEQAQAEAQRAESAEAELARVRAELAELKRRQAAEK